MGAKIGTIDFNGGYVGGTAIDKLYCGSTLLWPLGADIPLTYIANGEDSTSGSTMDVYFDTGHKPSGRTKIEIKYSATQINTSNYIISGDYSTQVVLSNYSIYVNNNNLIFSYADNTDYVLKAQSNNITSSPHIVTTSLVDHGGFSTDYYAEMNVDSTLIRGNNMPEIGEHRNFNLLMFDAEKGYGGTKIYYLKIWNGSTLVKNFVPVLHNNVPCFKDNVSGNYIYNLGSDTLVYE